MINGAKEGTLLRVIDKIANTKNNEIAKLEYVVIIHTPVANYNVTFLVDIGWERNYITALTDKLIVNCMLPAGDYVKEIYPYRDNLEITIRKNTPVQSISRRYKALVTSNLKDMSSNYYNRTSKEELNKLEQTILKVQCIDRYYEAMRNINVSAILRTTTVKNMVLGYMGSIMQSLKIAGGYIEKMPIELAEPDNPRTYVQIILPPDTKLLDVPSYLQETDYGVYNGGIGTYIQYYNKNEIPTLFVYPVHSTVRHKLPIKKLMVYAANTAMYDNVRNTYMIDGDILNIIGTSKVQTFAHNANKVIDGGVAILGANPNKLVTNQSFPTDDSTYVSSEDTVIAQELYKPRDGNQNIKYVGYQDNLYKERSKALARTVQIVQIKWNFCDMDLIYPGMPVIYSYSDAEKGIVKMVGTVISTGSVYTKATGNSIGLINIAVNKL